MRGLWNWFWDEDGFGPDGCANAVGKGILVIVLIVCVVGIGASVRRV